VNPRFREFESRTVLTEKRNDQLEEEEILLHLRVADGKVQVPGKVEVPETEASPGYRGREKPERITERQEKRHVHGEPGESLGGKDEVTWASVHLVDGAILIR
jgi:hypothetical protein